MNKRLPQTKTTNLEFISFSVLFIITLLSGFALTSSKSHAADTAVANTTVTVSAACSMTGTLDIDHFATLDGGTYSGGTTDYSNGIGRTTLKAFCNDSNGFAIYAIGFTGDVYIGENHTKLVGTNPDNTIITGTATSGDVSNWAMKLEKITDSSTSYHPELLTIENSFDSYHAVPDIYTKVATYSSTTDATLGVRLTTTYAAYVTASQAADTYTGKVKYTLVHPSTEVPPQPHAATAGCINYFANASNAVGTMGCQSAVDDETLVLLAPNYSREGYGFAGWSDVFDYATNADAHFYGPQETITVPTGTTANGLSLYAVWIKSAGYLQDASTVDSICNSLTQAPATGADLTSVSALSDKRDNNTYAIAKLADGNCWMIENLRLENTNSDNSAGALAQGYGKYTGVGINYGSFSGLAEPESTGFTNVYTANSLYYSVTQEGTASINIGGQDSPALRMPRYNNRNNQVNSIDRPQNPTENDAVNSTTDAGMYAYGNNYTWHAAVADTAYYQKANHNTTSICPAGWKLPIGSSPATPESYGALSVALGGPANGFLANNNTVPTGLVMSGIFRSYPNNFLYSGDYRDNSEDNRGYRGSYWTCSVSGTSASGMDLWEDWVEPGTINFSKHIALSVRCMADF